MTKKESFFDIAIVGAGPSGSTLANSLLINNRNVRVGLIDTQIFPRAKICGDGLGTGVTKILQSLHLSDIFKNKEPITQLVIKGPNGSQLIGDLTNSVSQQWSGYIVKREEFDHYLFRCAIEKGCIDVTNWRLLACSFANENWKLELESNSNQKKTLYSRVIVGADGARSRVRRHLGIKYNNKDNTGIAIRAYFTSMNINAQTMEMCFLKELLPGYGWIFPVSKNTLNIGVCIDVSKLRKKKDSLTQLFDRYLYMVRKRYPLEEIKSTRGTYVLPYGTQLPRLTSNQSAVIGDAGSMINPFTGEGLFYGMYAGKLLGEHLAKSFNENSSINQSLKVFEKEFKRKFVRHYKRNNVLKKLWSNMLWSNLVIKACKKDSLVLDEGIELIMGEDSTLKFSTFLNIFKKGLFQHTTTTHHLM